MMKRFSKFRVWLLSFLSGMNFLEFVYSLLAGANLLVTALAFIAFCFATFVVWAEFASEES